MPSSAPVATSPSLVIPRRAGVWSSASRRPAGPWISRSTVSLVLVRVEEKIVHECGALICAGARAEMAVVRHLHQARASNQPRVLRRTARTGDVIQRFVTLNDERRR